MVAERFPRGVFFHFCLYETRGTKKKGAEEEERRKLRENLGTPSFHQEVRNEARKARRILLGRGALGIPYRLVAEMKGTKGEGLGYTFYYSETTTLREKAKQEPTNASSAQTT